MTRRIAIADDDTDFRSLLAQSLRRAGFEVEEASDGLELMTRVVRAFAEGRPPHVVVTDMNMPRFDGFEVVGRIRALYTTLPVVMITALPNQEVRDRASNLEHTYLLEKPFAASDLCELVLGLPEPVPRPSWAA